MRDEPERSPEQYSESSTRSHWISRHYHTDDFPKTLALDDKLAIFADQVRGWQLDVAERLEATDPAAGFAVLSIVLSYFEMIAKCADGYTKAKSRNLPGSADYFKDGVKRVLPAILEFESIGVEVLDDLLKRLYDDVRCGLYHQAMTGPGIEVTSDTDAPLVISARIPGLVITINPHQLTKAIQRHFSRYLATLLDPANTVERKCFERYFDGRDRDRSS